MKVDRQNNPRNRQRKKWRESLVEPGVRLDRINRDTNRKGQQARDAGVSVCVCVCVCVCKWVGGSCV